MSIAALTPRIREALGVSASYDAETIPAAIKRAAKRLLRDYNFPKALKVQETALAAGEQSWTLPEAMGKPLALRLYNPSDGTYSRWLERRDAAVGLSEGDLSSWRWWLAGTQGWLSNPFDNALATAGFEVHLVYQNLDPDADGGWIYSDFEDVLYYATVYREASTMRKPEVQQAFAPLYQEEITALAIYLNELEWQGVVVEMREARAWRSERYPK